MNSRVVPVLRWTGLGLAAGVLAFGPLFTGLFYWTQLLFAQALMALAFLLWAASRRLEGKPLDLFGGFAGGALLALALCYLVLLPISLYPRGDLDWVLRTLAAWLLFVMMRQESSPTTRRAFSWILTVSMTAVAIIGLLQYTGYFARDPQMLASLSLVNLADRLSATFQYPNTAAIMFLLGLLAAVGATLDRPSPRTLPLALLMANLLFIAFFFALSRGAVLVLPVALLLLFAGLPRGSRWPALVALCAAIAPALAALRGVGANSAIQNYVSAWRWIAASEVAAALGGLAAAWFLRLPGRAQIRLATAGLTLAILLVVAYAVRIAPATTTGGQTQPLMARLLPKQAARLLDMNLKTINVQLRLNADRDAWSIFLLRPWGSGGWAWERSYRQVQTFNYVMRETHDHYAQTLVEAGPTGLLALLAAIAVALWGGLKRSRPSSDGRSSGSPGASASTNATAADSRAGETGTAAAALLWCLTVAAAALAWHAAIDFDLSFGSVWLTLWAIAGLLSPPPTAVHAGRSAGRHAQGSEKAALRAALWMPKRSLSTRSLHGLGPALVAGLVLITSLTFGRAAQLGDRADRLLAAGKPEAARSLLERAQRLDPWNSELVRLLGEARQRTGDLGGASAALRKATALDPDYPRHWTQLGTVYAATGQTAAATETFTRALALQPMLGDHYSRLARTLSDQMTNALLTGQRADAESAARAAVELGRQLQSRIDQAAQFKSPWAPPTWTPLIRFAYGQGAYLTGDLAAAEAALREANKDPVIAPQADLWLYGLCERTGNLQSIANLQRRPWIQLRTINPLYAAIRAWR